MNHANANWLLEVIGDQLFVVSVDPSDPSNGTDICKIYVSKSNPMESIGNAHMISIAPQMYAMLKAAAKAFNIIPNHKLQLKRFNDSYSLVSSIERLMANAEASHADVLQSLQRQPVLRQRINR